MNTIKKYVKYVLPIIDLAFIHTSYILALFFRFSTTVPYKYTEVYIENILPISIIYLMVLFAFRLYSSMWTLASIDEFILGITGCISSSLAVLAYSYLSEDMLPLSVYVMASILISILVLGIRIAFRIYRIVAANFEWKDTSGFKRVLIVGAGEAGYMTLKEMKRHSELEYLPIGFVDDSENKKGIVMGGLKVYGSTKDIPDLVKSLYIDVIVVAIPSISSREKSRILSLCNSTGCKVKIIPGMYEIIGDPVNLSAMRDLDLKDLLGREPIELDKKGISSYIQDEVVLVTGGGGSIGSELCRQIASYNPKKLIILDIYENNAYELQMELLRKYKKLDLKVLISSVRDIEKLEIIFETYRPTVVFHAAAHKHVPLMEFSPDEAIKNNVLGTLNTAECADKYNTKKFVLISTDKAVNPTNIMGATKRICEMIIQAINVRSKTDFVAVRFGNVLGSNGSVIPLFKKQIEEGGPVTVTHKEITRYFMLIPEAVELVLQAGAFAKGGEIFVLDMGEPVKIYDLAEQLIRLMGYRPHVDIKIEVTGLRPGEKLYEELLMSEEGLTNTSHKKIFIGKPAYHDFYLLKNKISILRNIIKLNNADKIKEEVKAIVSTYQPDVAANSDK